MISGSGSPDRFESSEGKAAAEFPAGTGHVGRVQDGRHDADPRRAGGQHGIQIAEMDSANRKPRHRQVGGGPTDIIQGHRGAPGLGAGGENRSDRHVIGPGRGRTLGLFWRMGTEADFAASGPIREFPDMPEAGVEEVFLPEVADFGPDFTGDFQVIIDDEPDTRRPGHRRDFLRKLANGVNGLALGPELNQIRAAVAKLAGNPDRITAGEVGRVHKGVETAFRQGLHPESASKPSGYFSWVA